MSLIRLHKPKGQDAEITLIQESEKEDEPENTSSSEDLQEFSKLPSFSSLDVNYDNNSLADLSSVSSAQESKEDIYLKLRQGSARCNNIRTRARAYNQQSSTASSTSSPSVSGNVQQDVTNYQTSNYK